MFLQDAIVVCHGGGREGDGEFWRSGCGVVSLQGAIVVCYFCKKDNSHFWWSGRLGALFFFALALPKYCVGKDIKTKNFGCNNSVFGSCKKSWDNSLKGQQPSKSDFCNIEVGKADINFVDCLLCCYWAYFCDTAIFYV